MIMHAEGSNMILGGVRVRQLDFPLCPFCVKYSIIKT